MTLFNDQRKKKVIDIPMQAQFAVEILLHVLVFFSLAVLVLYAEPFATWFSTYPADTHQNAVEWLIALNLPKWPLFVGVAAVVVIVSIMLSHRIAGPFYKLSAMMKQYAARDLSGETYLRKHDYFQPIVPVINEFRLNVSADLRSIAREMEQLKGIAKTLPDDGREQVEKIAGRVYERIGSYRLSDGE